MDENQFKKLMKELSDLKNLLILNISKAGATSEEIGKCLGVGGSQIRNIITGIGKKKVEKNEKKSARKRRK